MRDRILATLTIFLALAGAVAAPLPAAASVAPVKVVIIVGPVGSMTDGYRSQADQIAAQAQTDGATVLKVYSPNATWPAVKAAVAGANIIVYLGHGNGYPNPYSSTYLPDRDDGWGLNTTTTHGDADSWSAGTLVYCGEKALTGTLTSSDGANQRTYCGGSTNTDGIAPAPGFVMVYSNACYAPGASEPGAAQATPTQALQRASYFSRPMLTTLGGSGYFATDHGATPIVHALVTTPNIAYGDIYDQHLPSGMTATNSPHALVSGLRSWQAVRSSDPYYTYTFVGDPSRTFAGGHADLTTVPPPAASLPPSPVDTSAPTLTAHAPGGSSVATSSVVSVTFSEPVSGVAGSSFALVDGATLAVVPATVSYNPTTRVATLQPSAALAAGHTYHPWLSAAIHDLAGNPLASLSWPFTTASGQVTVYSPAKLIHFSAGGTTGYKFDSAGHVIATRTSSLASASSAAASQRSKAIPGHSGAWFSVVNGIWAGYWVAESTRTYLPGIAEQISYSPVHSVSFLAGTYTGYRFSSSWAVSSAKAYTLPRASAASTSSWAVINGRSYAYIVNGVWAGYWVPTGGGVTIH